MYKLNWKNWMQKVVMLYPDHMKVQLRINAFSFHVKAWLPRSLYIDAVCSECMAFIYWNIVCVQLDAHMAHLSA
jgi:hypothetical protein